jgi:hypothetical protein
LDACFVVGDGNDQQFAYVYFEDEPGRRSAAKLLTWMRRGELRQACIRWAEIWLESALRVERLAALLEHPSKEPMPATDYEWVLPPFGEWRRKGTSL